MRCAKHHLFFSLVLGPFFTAAALQAQDFTVRAEAILSSGPFAGALAAAVFASAEDGAVHYSRNADVPLVPASTAKLATSAAALERLTPGFRFTTAFLVNKGELGRKKISALVWRGTGDPSISGRDRASMEEIFEAWASSLAALGTVKVKRLVLDGRYFEGPAVHPSWPDGELSYWYQAETSAIAFNDNCVDLEFRPADKPGRRPKIVLTPDFGYLKVENKAVTGAPDSAFTLDYRRDPGSNRVTFFGSIPAGRVRKDWISVHEPARFAAEALKRVWKKKGVAVSEIVSWEEAGLKEEELAAAFTWNSEPLGKLIKTVNTNSQNLYAEHILKTLGAEMAHRASFEGGIGIVNDFLGSAGLTPEEYRLVDGSGLSQENRFTAAGLVRLLLYMRNRPLFPVYYESLSATKKRMKEDPLAAGMRLKSGTVGPARNLAGYLHSASGKLYAFAVLVNGPGLDREAVDEWVDRLCISAAHQLP